MGWQGLSGVAHAFSRSHTYDVLGRPKSTTTLIDGVSYPGEIIYDALGRAARVRDATGQWSKTTYDTRGFARGLCYSSAVDADPACATPWLTTEEADAWGNVTREIRSWTGQLPVTRTYNALTGRLERICEDKPGSGGACDLVDEGYAWDKAGNLHTRQKDTRYIESFQYDWLNRLSHGYASVAGGAEQLTHWAQYDRLGNTCARLSDDAGYGVAFGYVGRAGCGAETPNGDGGAGDIGAHQVSQVYSGPLAGSYHYDNRGNHTLRDVAGTAKDRRIRYSADDRPYEISLGSAAAPSQRARFWYGPDGQRYKREDLGGKRTLYLGNVEVVTQGAQTTMRRMIGGSLLQLVVNGGNENRFLFHDQLGSLVKATDSLGTVVHALDYMPNGTRRNTGNPQQPVDNSPALTPRGFTGHEHVDGFDVIHMNGRIYDPTLGRFLQPDPVVQAPMGSQGWNAYTYVFNNPLAYTDPTGLFSWKKIWRPLVAIVASVVTYGAATGWATAWLAGTSLATNAVAIGAIAGGIAGFAGGAIATGTFKGGVQGAFSGLIFGGIAGHFGGGFSWGNVTASGVAGGVLADLQGGKFGHGFLSAGVVAAAGPGLNKIDNGALRATTAAIVGGTVSELTGGKFANGAATAALMVAAASYYQENVGGRATLRPGEIREGQASYELDRMTGQQREADRSMLVIGLNRDMDGGVKDFFAQGGPLSRAMNRIPGMNSLARTHDYWLRGPELGGMSFNSITNFGTMLPAAGGSYGALLGQVFQPLSYQQILGIAISSSHDRDGRRSYAYLGAMLGGD
ncbi:RHS repeat domain-containing protein [Luteimonas sp. A537]